MASDWTEALNTSLSPFLLVALVSKPDCQACWPPVAQNLGQMCSHGRSQKQLNGEH